jgi:ATP-dependent RNA helicase RhlE
MPQTLTPQGFRALALSPKLHDLLDKLAFVTPTPIQAGAIPFALQGRDIVGIAQTGTGKTLAFGLPIVHRLYDLNGPALILVPTRELALQVEEVLRKVAGHFGMKTACLIGGAPMGKQVGQLRARPAIIVATPGRLMDHMEQRTVNLSNVSIVVLDEADRMLDMGFAPAIRKILQTTPNNRQTMLFSATMPNEIASLAADFLRNPERVEVEPPGTTVELISQELYMVEQPDKGDLLSSLLRDHTGTVLVFARTRHGARKVARSVRGMGHTAAELHSDRTLAQRKSALQGFKTGEYRVLVATDIAARGIDVKGISLVINYDLPDNPDDYVHRIGRTGRAGESGLAITLATPDQTKDIRDIERSIRTEIPLSQHSPLGLTRMRQAPSRTMGHQQRFRAHAPSVSRFSTGGFSSRRPRR